LTELFSTTYPFQFSHTQRGWHTSKIRERWNNHPV